MAYVEGFILAVPEANLAAYRKMAKKAGEVWIEHGALAYVECVGDDVPRGKTTSFPRAVKLKDDEIVIFAWITYRTAKHRDAVMKKVMADPRMTAMVEGREMPFDGRRMIFGSFKTLVEMKAP